MSDQNIHPSAIIGPQVRLGEGVVVREHVIIEGEVSIGDGTVIEPFVIIRGPTDIGRRNHIYQFCSIGEGCQDLKYKGEPTRLRIGDDNTIREHCTMHRGTVQGNSVTVVGNHNLFMVNTHVAHDCTVGDNCIFANNATLAGHVTIDDWVIFGGLAAIHQFGRVGCHAFIAGMAALNMDVPPYVMAAGHYAKPYGINKVGLSRRGFTEAQVALVRKAYMELYHSKKTLEEALESIEVLAAEDEAVISPIITFIKESERGIIR
ncbi:MAG: acyl-ACP--UDP-N-acetylglucosamine O-acyltransferase [Succinivibrionaceae bacterium]|nr:acyl-ACP--UDP-N-acetylglucosamine O-acyltransferase [Succinivibrionaceae bacterium]